MATQVARNRTELVEIGPKTVKTPAVSQPNLGRLRVSSCQSMCMMLNDLHNYYGTYGFLAELGHLGSSGINCDRANGETLRNARATSANVPGSGADGEGMIELSSVNAALPSSET